MAENYYISRAGGTKMRVVLFRASGMQEPMCLLRRNQKPAVLLKLLDWLLFTGYFSL